ncbi:MAG TPA: ABC transporter ATP-binding protein [Ktedonobacterales bacterium]
MIAHFGALSETRRALMLRDRVLTQALDSIFANSVSVGTGLVLLLAAADMRAGTFTLGDFALFVAYLDFVAEFTEFLGRFLAHLKQTGVSFERLASLVRGTSPAILVAHEPLALRGPLPAPLAAPSRAPTDRLATLEARELTYRYAEHGRGIEGINLRVARGEFVVVTGRVGAGKTTLLRVLLGLVPTEAGAVLWNGAPVADPAAFFVPPRSAYTPQAPRLFSASLRENILLGLPDDDDQLAAALHAAALEEDVAALEQGLETEIGARGVRLSGGQAQRAAAARMFARGPELLVIDDLSSALDVETERRLWERLFARDGEVTCLAVSHRRAALQRADRILVLRDGQLEAEGTLPDQLERSAEMRRLWSGEEERQRVFP